MGIYTRERHNNFRYRWQKTSTEDRARRESEYDRRPAEQKEWTRAPAPSRSWDTPDHGRACTTSRSSRFATASVAHHDGRLVRIADDEGEGPRAVPASSVHQLLPAAERYG